MEKNKHRSATFDIMKFIGIICVIVGHMTTIGVNVIFSFHMPLFFIIAGYFYHQKGIRLSVQADFKRLVQPYIFTASFIVCTYAFMRILKNDIDVVYWLEAALYGNGSTNHSSLYLAKVPTIGAIWFLLALFWCKNAFNIIYSKSKYWMLVSIVISVLAILVDKYLVNLPFAMLPGMGAIIFYAIGVIIRQQGGFLKISPFLWSVFIIVWLVSFLFSDMSMVRCYYKDILINIIGACGGTYGVFLVSDLLSTYHNGLVRLVTWGG